MEKEELKYLYFLTRVPKLGNVKIKTLIDIFGKASSVFNQNPDKLQGVQGISRVITDYILSAQENFKIYETDFENLLIECEKKKIKIITLFDDEYPLNLKTIFDAPVILYYKGCLNANDAYSIGIVGTRYPSEYGKNACIELVKGLSGLGIPVISGMARGIDSTAHKVALESQNLTYAVLGSGSDVVYPFENKKLYESIIETGAILSELEPGAKPDKVNFPRRNRIISGISLGTVIVESALRGGSLITAEFALDQNREIFAVPGTIYSKNSGGTNNLIKKGIAKLITNVDDILAELEYKLSSYLKKEKAAAVKPDIDLNIFEKKIFDIMGTEPLYIDDVSEKTDLSISDCLVNLLTLEFKGIIRQIPGKYFIKL